MGDTANAKKKAGGPRMGSGSTSVEFLSEEPKPKEPGAKACPVSCPVSWRTTASCVLLLSPVVCSNSWRRRQSLLRRKMSSLLAALVPSRRYAPWCQCLRKTIDKKDAKDGKAKEEKPKPKIDDKSKAKTEKPKPKDEKSKAKADEKPKVKAKVDDKSKPKTEDKSKAKADEKSKPKTDEKSKAKDSKAGEWPVVRAAR